MIASLPNVKPCVTVITMQMFGPVYSHWLTSQA